MSNARPEIDWQPHTAAGEKLRGLRDDPGRILLMGAAVGLLLGGLMPWAEGRDPAGLPVAYTPQQALAEGYIMIVLALALAVLARSRVLVESKSRTVQLLPLALAFIAAAMWLGAERTSLIYIEDWTSGGGHGTQTFWRLLTLVAIVAIVAGTLWLDRTRPADVRAQTRPLSAEWRPSRVGVLEALAAGVLGVVGAVLGGALTFAALGANGSFFAVFITLVGMAAGISAGLGIVRWFRGGADRARPEPSMQSSNGRITVSRVERRRP